MRTRPEPSRARAGRGAYTTLMNSGPGIREMIGLETLESWGKEAPREEESERPLDKTKLARYTAWLAWSLLVVSLPVLSIGVTLWITGPAWFYYRETDIVRKISTALMIAGPVVLVTGLAGLLLSRRWRPKRAHQLNLNMATVEELQALPGIGRIRATAIVEYRQQQGSFRAMSDLVKVPGIGWTTLEGLRDMVTLES